MAFLLLCGTLDNFNCEREKLQVAQSAWSGVGQWLVSLAAPGSLMNAQTWFMESLNPS